MHGEGRQAGRHTHTYMWEERVIWGRLKAEAFF